MRKRHSATDLLMLQLRFEGPFLSLLEVKRELPHFKDDTYSRTSLSRTRLFQITAYFEVKIWSLF